MSHSPAHGSRSPDPALVALMELVVAPTLLRLASLTQHHVFEIQDPCVYYGLKQMIMSVFSRARISDMEKRKYRHKMGDPVKNPQA